MTPIHPSVIWDRWNNVKHIFGNKTDAWMRLIRIAAAGEEGLSHADLFPRTNGWHQIHRLRDAGLVEVRRLPREPGCLGAPKHRIIITQKGLNFLRMTQAPASPPLPIS